MSDPLPRITCMEVAARDPLETLRDIERRKRALDAEMLQEIGRLAGEWIDDPSVPGLAYEMAASLGISAYSAEERERIATALLDLPHIARAHADGLLSWDQLRWLTKFATPETDDEWAVRAQEMPPWRLREEAERQRRVRREEAERAHRMRRLSMTWDQDGRYLEVYVELAGEDGVIFQEALQRAARDVEHDPGADDPRGARLADALLHLVTSSGRKSSRPTMVVHVDAEVLTGTSDGTRKRSETSSGMQLHPETIRRMACMARVRVAIEREGTMVGLVSASRGPTPAQMDALWFRDRMCSFPGCEAKRFVSAHHIHHWTKGGPTTMDNLTLLCGRHHRMLHEGGWTIRGRPPDGLEFVDRWGNVRSDRTPVLARAG